MVEKVSVVKCEWCDGSGIDSEGVSLGNPYACIDCRGTGFEEGEKAARYYAHLLYLEEEVWVKKGQL